MSPSPLSSRRLQYFVETCQRGSLRRAADHLGVEASVISRQLRLLEQELGTVLLARQGRRLAPTDAGLLLLAHGRERRASEESLRARLDEISQLKRGTLRLVAGEGFLDSLVHWVLRDFCHQYPGIQVSLIAADSLEVVRRVAQDEAHIGITLNAPAAEGVEIAARQPHPLCAIVWPGHPLAALPQPISLSQASAYPLGLMTPGYGLHQIIQLAAFLDHLTLAPAFTTNSIASLKRYVRDRSGLTFFSAQGVASDIAEGSLLALRTSNAVFEAAEAQILLRAGRPPHAALQALLDLLLQRRGAFWWRQGAGGAPAGALSPRA